MTVLISARGLAICAEALLLYVTCVKTRRTHRLGLKTGTKTPLASLLLRDGVLHFGYVGARILVLRRIDENTSRAMLFTNICSILALIDNTVSPILRTLLNVKRSHLRVGRELPIRLGCAVSSYAGQLTFADPSVALS